MEKSQNRCMSGRRDRRGDGMGVLVMLGREILSPLFGRYYLATVIFSNMSYGLEMPLGSHRSTNSALVLH
jgi:hypothetical protein